MTLQLAELGWDAQWARTFEPFAARGLVPARVAIEFNHLYRLYAETGEWTAEQAGRVKYRAAGRADLAAVGDWVAARPIPGGQAALIEAVLPRRSQFSRKVAGQTTERQVVAANLDTVFVVMGLDGDFNLRRLERYLLLAGESGARPVVVLNKADLAADVAARVREARSCAPALAVHAVSARRREGLEALLAHLGPGRTGALLGSSGVGKSTIVNALVGAARLETQEVRMRDARGRHTTRHRQLIVMAGRGLLIDTPGMREVQLWAPAAGAGEPFEDIAALAAGCHFSDCRHRDEPRCAVRAAVGEGRLAADRLASFHKLQDELAILEQRRRVRRRLDLKRRDNRTSRR